MSKRVAFVKVQAEHEWADARYDVLLDGERIGEVVKYEEAGGRRAASGRYYTSSWVKSVWEVSECVGGRVATLPCNSRVDAVVDMLIARGMSYMAAREAAGKRGI